MFPTSVGTQYHLITNRKKNIGWFQKISIPIQRVASRNSGEGEGGLRRLEFRGHGGGGSLDWNSEGMGGFSRE